MGADTEPAAGPAWPAAGLRTPAGSIGTDRELDLLEVIEALRSYVLLTCFAMPYYCMYRYLLALRYRTSIYYTLVCRGLQLELQI